MSLLVPRDYQIDARDALWDYFETYHGNPLVLMPTGTGKSVVIGDFVRSVLYAFPSTRVVAITHVETLIKQNFDKLKAVWPTAPAGIHSASLDRRDTLQPIIFAGIQSVFDKAHIFRWVDILIIDEAHLVGPNDEAMYQLFINALRAINPLMKIVGLTATGWRLGSGELVQGGIFTDIAIDMTTPAGWNWFIDNGYLSPLSTKRTVFHMDADGVGMAHGEFNMGQLQKHVDREGVTRSAVEETIQWGQDRHSWMVFGTGVRHCDHIADMMQEYGVNAVAIHSKSKNPADLIEAFKAGEYRCAVSMNKLTTGVDAPGIDMIACMRHTMSSSLWVQMLGRGTRPVYAPGYDLSTASGRLSAIAAGPKSRGCLVLDFARNTENLGPINNPRIPPKKKQSKGAAGSAPVRVCPVCLEYCAASARFCYACGHEFEIKVYMDGTASDLEVMTREAAPEPVVELLDVERVTYTYHKRRNSDKPPSLCVTYYVPGMMRKYQEYICFEHDGAAKTRARNWWLERLPLDWPRDMPVPVTVLEAQALVENLRIPKRIRVWVNAAHPRIMSYEYA